MIWAQGVGPDARERHDTDDRRARAAAESLRRQVRHRGRDRELFLAAGAAGSAAIYTQRMHAIHILRKIILRVGAYLDYLIMKLH